MLVSRPVEEHAIRVTPKRQGKARPAGKGRNAPGHILSRKLVTLRRMGALEWLPSARTGGLRLRCTRLDWPRPLLHSRALPHIPPELADSALFYGTGH